MYYDSIEDAIAAAPNCTHVLTTGDGWLGDGDIVGKFQPVNYTEHEGSFEYLNAVMPSPHDGSVISADCWVVARSIGDCHDTASQSDTICKLLDEAKAKVEAENPTTEQRVTAARFDLASGRIPAHQFLESGMNHMKNRASQRDAENGERSMKRCVDAFNALEGTNLTEKQGWRFMVLLKYARSVNGVFTADDYEDMAAYAGLAGECASQQGDTINE